MNADYIIVGQGLAGSALAVELIRRGKEVVVIDEPTQNRSSIVSAGICNPITGRAMSKSWLADSIFPFINEWYPKAEDMLGIRVFHPVPIFRPFISELEREEWTKKSASAEFEEFGQPMTPGEAGEGLNAPYGALHVRQSAYVDVAEWMAAVSDLLKDQGRFREEHFDDDDVELGDAIRYRDIRASRIVFCRGLAELKGKWFGRIPLRTLKGETLMARMDLNHNQVISRGVYIVPHRKVGHFVVGSTYEHPPFEPGVTAKSQSVLLDRLRALVNVPVEIIHQDWGIRPTVIDRRPILGHHPEHPNLIIFNGLGTKGVSLSPYFASLLADCVEKGVQVPQEVNISRFNTLYSD